LRRRFDKFCRNFDSFPLITFALSQGQRLTWAFCSLTGWPVYFLFSVMRCALVCPPTFPDLCGLTLSLLMARYVEPANGIDDTFPSPHAVLCTCTPFGFIFPSQGSHGPTVYTMDYSYRNFSFPFSQGVFASGRTFNGRQSSFLEWTAKVADPLSPRKLSSFGSSFPPIDFEENRRLRVMGGYSYCLLLFFFSDPPLVLCPTTLFPVA